MRVQRGRDWIWEKEDYLNGFPGFGYITLCWNAYLWSTVAWDSGYINDYRIGKYGKYDLYSENKPSK